MLTAAFPKLASAGFTRYVRAFFRSWVYPCVVALLMAIAEIFGFELPVYYLYLLMGALCLLLCEDTLGIFPLVGCSFMSVSAANNPSRNYQTSLFTQPYFIYHLALIVAVAGVLLVGRLVVCLIEQPRRGFPRLVPGFALLGLAYLLSGAFSGYYAWDTVIFGALEIVSLCALYLFFHFTVDWKKTRKDSVVAMMFAIGAGLFLETVGMYFLPGAIQNGDVVRGNLYTGWGVYNNVGCMLAMCMPAPFYYAFKRKNGWIYAILGCVMFLGVVLTQSRGAILFGAVVFLACVILTLVLSKGKERWANAIVFGALIVAAAVGIFVLRDRVAALFSSLSNAGFGDSGRINIYKNCWNTFLSSPVFGAGWYHTPGAALSVGGTMNGAGALMPPRAHNTVFQLLATGGVFAMIAYLAHRAQTLVLLFRKPSAEKAFVALSLSALLLTSLLDCNLFNLGPGIFYGALLAYAEGQEEPAPFRKRRRLQPLS